MRRNETGEIFYHIYAHILKQYFEEHPALTKKMVANIIGVNYQTFIGFCEGRSNNAGIVISLETHETIIHSWVMDRLVEIL